MAGGGDAAADADLKAALGRSRAGEQQRAEQQKGAELLHGGHRSFLQYFRTYIQYNKSAENVNPNLV